VTAPLAVALGLALAIGLASGVLFALWPRRLTAEEWMFHRRAVSAVPAVGPQTGARGSRLPIGSGWWTDLWLELAPAPETDLRLLRLLDSTVPTDATRRDLGTIAASAGSIGLVLMLVIAISTQSIAAAVAAPVVALAFALGAPVLRTATWKLRARRMRRTVQRRMPRVLTGARVLLEAGAVTPEGALAAAVAAYDDPASGLLREALRVREVRRLELEAALDEVATDYGDDEIHKLADAFRVGHRYGTGMSALLSDVCRRMRHAWHATYRERISRAPVLMLLPALVFFVLPLLGLVMFLIFSPLLGTLQRL